MEKSLPFVVHRLDGLLRSVLQTQNGAKDELPFRTVLQMVTYGGGMIGLMIGSYPLFNGASGWFSLFSALKVPLFLGLTVALTLPAMRVLYTLWGLGEEFSELLRALAGSQAIFTLILASLTPLTLVAYGSGLSYRGALIWNVSMFALAAFITQRAVRDQLAEVMRRDVRHLRLLKMGAGIWCFVAIQLAWNLRPFIGSPRGGPQFFRPDAFTNAYLALWSILVG